MGGVILIEIGTLRGHEEVIPDNLEKRSSKLLDRGFYKPIIVDRDSLVILDGHHKWTAARLLGLDRVPVVMVDYLLDESVNVGVWPGCGRESITKDEVLEMGLSEGFFPPKTSRHIFPFRMPTIRIPLEELKG
tara:strand:- start:43 stop:441 length:399 start_codon:yes stop_codon:yes gene_type:complete